MEGEIIISKIILETIKILPELVPEEGEVINIYSGLGSKIVYQCKRENGILYQKTIDSGEWQKLDLTERYNSLSNDLNADLYNEFDRREKTGWVSKLRRFFKIMFT